jgi:hypothetical protein
VIAAAAIVGILGSLIAAYCYPPVDMNRSVPVPMLLIVFVPLVLARVAIKREESKKIAVVVALFLNGKLDTYPAAEIKTRVIAKSVRYRSLSSGVLTVAPSWRDGRTEETPDVSSATFYAIAEGQLVQVVVHRGAFGLPWYSSVLPD